MKEIKAIIRPNKLPGLRDALREIPGFPGMTVSKVEGCSAPTRHVPGCKVKEALTDYTPKVRIEIIAPDELADNLADCIIRTAQTGQIGDGIVWITDVERATFLYKTMPGAGGS